MKCPVCGETDLLLSERQGIEIDYCPKCRGVWLDRGELDKLIERSATEGRSGPYAGGPSGGRDDYSGRPEQRRGDEYYDGKHHRKRRSFLGDFFDFD